MVTAKRLFDNLTKWGHQETSIEEMWKLVVETYEKHGLDERDALQQARVARILRHGEYNNQTKEISLWIP